MYGHGLLLGVTVHEFMLISICQCLCNIMGVSWVSWFYRVRGLNGFIGFMESSVSWFHEVNDFMGSMESRFL